MKSIFGFFLLFGLALQASTPTNYVPTDAAAFGLNRWMGPVGLKYSLGTVLKQAHNTAVGVWDYAQQGGITAGNTVNYDIGVQLPNKAIIRFVFFDAVTTPVNSGGSVKFGLTANSAADLKALTAYSTFSGRVSAIPDGTVSNMVKLTANRSVYMIVSSASVGTLTAGKIKVFIDYVVSE